jgi:ClpP class serine protease
MDDMHASFKAVVRAARGDRLRGPDAELFSGRAWTGRQAAALGLVDGVGSLAGVMRSELGDGVRFLHCSDPSQPGLRELLGVARARPAINQSINHYSL